MSLLPFGPTNSGDRLMALAIRFVSKKKKKPHYFLMFIFHAYAHPSPCA
jgi:hypothetical protein